MHADLATEGLAPLYARERPVFIAERPWSKQFAQPMPFTKCINWIDLGGGRHYYEEDDCGTACY